MTDPSSDPAYHCLACGKDCGRSWTARCPHCAAQGQVAAGRAPRTQGAWAGGSGGKATLLREVPDADYERIKTGTREFDRVLGGGLVTGSVVLIAGEPGIGKSTILLQTGMLLSIAEIVEDDMPGDPLKILVASGEETEAQIKHRGLRIEKSGGKTIYLLSESNLDRIEEAIIEIDPDVSVFDSVNTMYRPGTEGAAGSIAQIKATVAQVVGISRARGMGSFVVAHVTKDGAVSGPKTLEHLVDCVLEFGREGTFDLRSIRASKNRFGDTAELALFKMTAEGLRSVENPSELLLEGHVDGQSGIAIGQACLQGGSTGGRPLHLEIQTLLGAPLGQGAPKRHVTGLSGERVTQALAILERRLGFPMHRDVFVNVPGGLSDRHTSDPALDLPLCLALASSVSGMPLPAGLCAFGEVGLGGEVRPAAHLETRLRAAGVMAFKTIMGPPLPEELLQSMLKSNTPDAKDGTPGDGVSRYKAVRSLEEAFDALELWPPEKPEEPAEKADESDAPIIERRLSLLKKKKP